MAHSRGKKFLEMKLTFLEEQQQQLSSLIHEKIDKCKSYLSGGEESTRCSFKEMNQMIEDAVEIVTHSVTQIEGECHESVPQETSAESSAELSVAPFDSSSLTVDKSVLTSLEPRMKKIEAAVRAVIDNLQMLTTRQTNIENGMGDLSVKHSKTEDKWMKQFDQVDGKMIDLTQREDDFVQQHDREIQSLKEENNIIKNSLVDLKKGLEDMSVKQCNAEDKWMKQFNQTDGKMTDLMQRDNEFVQQHDREIQRLKEENNIIKNSVVDLKKGLEDMSVKQCNAEDKWMKQFRQANDKITELKQRKDEFVQRHNREIQNVKQQLQTYEDKLKKAMAKGVESKKTVQATVDTLQQDMGTVQAHVQKLICTIQEQGEALQASKDDATKMKKITDELSYLTPKIQSLASKCARPAVGFTANLIGGIFTHGATVTGYRFLKCNTDKSFNVDTGIFTAPVKGMYYVCLHSWQDGDRELILRVLQTRKSCEKEEKAFLFYAKTTETQQVYTDSVVTNMMVGDTVRVVVETMIGSVYRYKETRFTCFLIN